MGLYRQERTIKDSGSWKNLLRCWRNRHRFTQTERMLPFIPQPLLLLLGPRQDIFLTLDTPTGIAAPATVRNQKQQLPLLLPVNTILMSNYNLRRGVSDQHDVNHLTQTRATECKDFAFISLLGRQPWLLQERQFLSIGRGFLLQK